MSHYDRFFNSKGKSGTLLAVKRDEARGLYVYIYYIGEDEHVGIRDGIDTWISPIPPNALFTMFDKHELQELIAKAKKGEVIDIEVPTLQRKKLVLEIPPVLRRKIQLHNAQQPEPVIRRRIVNA
jgi:hypothetical protein